MYSIATGIIASARRGIEHITVRPPRRRPVHQAQEKDHLSLLIIDPLAQTRGHLLEDDLFWASSLGDRVQRLKMVSSEDSVAQIKRTVPDLSVTPYAVFRRHLGCRFIGAKIMLRTLLVNTAGYRKVLFQSFHERAAIWFRLLHPRIEIYLIVTNNLTGRDSLPSRRQSMQRFLFSRVSAVIVHTRYERDLVLRLYPHLDPHKVAIKPFHKISRPRPILSFRERLHRISFLGRGVQDRGLSTFLKMAAADRTGRFTYGIYGTSKMTEEQQELFGSIAGTIDYRPEHLSDREYYEIIGTSLFVALLFDKSYEGRLSGILCDACACGTPVIASRIEPHIEFSAKYGPLGYLLEEEDISEFVQTTLSRIDEEGWSAFQVSLARARSDHASARVVDTMMQILGS